MDITADVAATGATTPAASAVGNQLNVSQHAAEKQRAKWLPQELLDNKLSPLVTDTIIGKRVY
jgi:hypothetical protein